MTKKKSSSKKKPKVWTKEDVLADWMGPLQKGLGSKKLSPAVKATFEAQLLKTIESRLQNPANDYNKDRKNVRTVAKALGKICKELTGPAAVVQLAVFEVSFAASQLHHKCPSTGGSGKWCS